jgi:hypothetical protein
VDQVHRPELQVGWHTPDNTGARFKSPRGQTLVDGLGTASCAPAGQDHERPDLAAAHRTRSSAGYAATRDAAHRRSRQLLQLPARPRGRQGAGSSSDPRIGPLPLGLLRKFLENGAVLFEELVVVLCEFLESSVDGLDSGESLLISRVVVLGELTRDLV